MISAILGHSIKSEKADKLHAEVEKFLAGNHEEKEYGKPAVRFNTSEKYIRGVSKNSTSTQDKEGRLKKQVPLLLKYKGVSNSRTCWLDLSKLIDGVVSACHLSRCSKGKTSISNIEVWRKVEDAINKIVGAKNGESNN